jgi:Protein of unknown function (DUF2723)
MWIATVVSIAAGYVLLARGGMTAPALLLVLGYVVLAPLAIYGFRDKPQSTNEKPPYRWAALVALAVLVLYALTLAPTTAMWDTSEYMAAAKDLGIPHPPGNPLFVLISYLFGTLPIAHDFAVRINLLAATASAVSAGLWFLVAFEVTGKLFKERWAKLTAAAVCALVGATSFTVWNQSVVNEKVYTVSLLQLTVVVWLAVRWTRQPVGAHADRLLVVIAYLLALGYTIHPAGYLAGPCIAAVVLLLAPKTFIRGRLILQVAAATVFGISLFAFEPIRSANHPMLNEGEPTACKTGFALNCTLSSNTVERLRAQVAREQYGKPPIFERWISFPAQLGMWWQYFTWQWLRDAHGAHPIAQMMLALLAMMLAITGARVHARTDRSTFVLIGTLVATLTVGLVFYLNFKYGYSQSPELGSSVPREVRDRDYFFLWSFSCLGVWIGLGIAECWRLVADRLERPRPLVYALPVLVIALIPLAFNVSTASRAGQTFTRDFAHDLLDSVGPNGILLTNGDNDTFPLWYAQDVEGYRRDVVVMVSSYLGTDWAPWQFLRRGVALASSPADADSVPNYIQLAGPQQFDAGGIHAIIPKGYLTRDQIFVLRMVQSVLPQRPIYFTNSIYPRALGLEPYLVIEGLAVRLMPTLPVESNDLVRVGTVSLINVPRSLALWRDTFKGYQAFEKQGEWIDQSSLVMPAQYVIAGAALAQALRQRGSGPESDAINAQVQRMLKIANLGSVFGPG